MALTAQQRNELRNVLELRYNALLSEIEADRAKATRSMSAAASNERPAGLQAAGVAEAELGRDWHEFEAVQQALARLDAGEYGTCVSCGTAIPWRRLASSPAAVRCLACQEARERGASAS
jgi:DnaK suppressor protein